MRSRPLWRQLAFAIWIVAVLVVYWIAEPASGFDGAAARFEVPVRAEAALKPVFHRDHVF